MAKLDPNVVNLETEQSLEKAVGDVRSEVQADRVLRELEKSAGKATEQDIQSHAASMAPEPVEPAAQAIKDAAERIATSPPEEEGKLDAAVEQAMGASAEATPEDVPPATARGRSLLRKRLLRRLKFFDKVDASLFLLINNLPHPKIADRLMYGLTYCMTGGGGWLAILAAAAIRQRKYAGRATLKIAPSMWVATTLVEYPVKKYFRRRRPFISIVRAIVVGRKPGNFSFPSGHTAAAFAGSTLLGIYFPKGRKWFRTLATLTGFSRIYVGAHYPGDVICGGVIGSILAKAVHSLLTRRS